MNDRFESLYPPDCWEEEIDKIIGFIKAGNSAEIIGLPGVGRSNLLGLLAYNRGARELHLGKDEQKKFHFILMNFSEMRNKNETEVLKFYFISIIDSLKERSMNEEASRIQAIFKETLEIPDQQVILQGLKKTIDYLSIEKKLTLILLIDRFEEYVPFLTTNFFTNLRALRNRAKYKFSVVFSTKRSLFELLEPNIIVDFYEFLQGNSIYLPLKDESSLKFRIDFLQQNAKNILPEDKIKTILELSAGHGKLTRLSIETCPAENDVSQEHNDDLIKILLSNQKINTLFKEIWSLLNPSEQNFLIEKGGTAPEFLEKINLLDSGKITIPLFEEYLKKEKNTLTNSYEGTIKYSPDSNEIKRGEIVISDKLTASEFKLLKYLLENEDKILERDEIISAVWKNLASTAGVTEQALDQLIFRMRKKIEENPNTPTHLLTIKGRGFKFTA